MVWPPHTHNLPIQAAAPCSTRGAQGASSSTQCQSRRWPTTRHRPGDTPGWRRRRSATCGRRERRIRPCACPPSPASYRRTRRGRCWVLLATSPARRWIARYHCCRPWGNAACRADSSRRSTTWRRRKPMRRPRRGARRGRGRSPASNDSPNRDHLSCRFGSNSNHAPGIASRSLLHCSNTPIRLKSPPHGTRLAPRPR